jgi:malonate-semialdehyde dehydrogenase (acetylating)/methylmalonate-semialdehyde dehydrogenase
MAGSVVVTVGDAHERLLPALKEATENVRVGDGLDEQNELGPVVSEAARERILGAVERGLGEGAELLVDGRDAGVAEGCFIGATILTDVTPDMELAREEIFGPVLSLIHVDTLGLPPGVVNLVNGGREVVEGMLDHPGIDAISFVGSAPVAKIVYERSAKAGKRVQALGGAKNHMVVMPDAVIDKTVNGIIGSAFGAAGQRCMAGSVVVTVGEAHDRLMPVLTAATESLVVGDGIDDGTEVGPVVSCAARDRVKGWIDRGVEDGATLVVDGRGVGGDGVLDPDGAFVGPTILDDVTPDMAIAQEEVFGPVLTVVHAESLDDAIAIINRSRFGNGTSIFTENGAAVRRFRHEVEAGMIGVNIGVAAPVAFFPFSGWKDSFLGDLHAHGPDAVEFFTRKKTVTSRWFSSGQGHGAYFVER